MSGIEGPAFWLTCKGCPSCNTPPGKAKVPEDYTATGLLPLPSEYTSCRLPRAPHLEQPFQAEATWGDCAWAEAYLLRAPGH